MGDAAGFGAMSMVGFYSYGCQAPAVKRRLSFGNAVYGDPMHGKGWQRKVAAGMMTRAMMRRDEPAVCVQPLHETKSSVFC